MAWCLFGKVDVVAKNRVDRGEKLGLALGFGHVAGDPELYRRGLYAERLLQNGAYKSERLAQPVPVAVAFQKGQKVQAVFLAKYYVQYDERWLPLPGFLYVAFRAGKRGYLGANRKAPSSPSRQEATPLFVMGWSSTSKTFIRPRPCPGDDKAQARPLPRLA